MSGFFGVASKESCVLDLFFGVDWDDCTWKKWV